MDTERARTFLTVIAAGNFVKAAERLFVTQSTVSLRIQSLEQELGCRLFVRNKSGTTLTAAGRQFQRHAVNLMRTVEQARQDLGVPSGYRSSLTVGGRFGIWEDLLLCWLSVMRTTARDIAIRAKIGFEDDLMLGLVDGHIDIAVLYTPQSRPGLKVEPLLEEKLVMVRTEATEDRQSMSANYVLVDWGSEFLARHGATFPDFTGPGLTANIGWLGLQYLINCGGSGYFPRRLVAKYLATGQLHLCPDAPMFTLPAYVVYPLERDLNVFDPALDRLRSIAAAVAAT